MACERNQPVTTPRPSIPKGTSRQTHPTSAQVFFPGVVCLPASPDGLKETAIKSSVGLEVSVCLRSNKSRARIKNMTEKKNKFELPYSRCLSVE